MDCRSRKGYLDVKRSRVRPQRWMESAALLIPADYLDLWIGAFGCGGFVSTHRSAHGRDYLICDAVLVELI